MPKSSRFDAAILAMERHARQLNEAEARAQALRSALLMRVMDGVLDTSCLRLWMSHEDSSIRAVALSFLPLARRGGDDQQGRDH